MLIGVFTGTYSSIFVAAPILVDMDKKETLKKEADRDSRIQELKKMAEKPPDREASPDREAWYGICI